jgi:hypothetical protein
LESVILPLLKKATQDAILPYIDNGVVKTQKAKVGLVGASEFLGYFDRLEWNDGYLGVIKPLRAFIATAMEKERIKDWGIVWPQRQTPGRMLWLDELGREAPIWKRGRRQFPRIDFTGENKRNLLSANDVPEGDDFPKIGKSGTRGVLVISLVADQEETTEEVPVDRSDVVGLISLRVPDGSVRSKRDLIQYAVVVSDKPGAIVVDDPDVA